MTADSIITNHFKQNFAQVSFGCTCRYIIIPVSVELMLYSKKQGKKCKVNICLYTGSAKFRIKVLRTPRSNCFCHVTAEAIKSCNSQKYKQQIENYSLLFHRKNTFLSFYHSNLCSVWFLIS